MARLTTTYCIAAALFMCLAVTGCRSTSLASGKNASGNIAKKNDRLAPQAQSGESVAIVDSTHSITLVAAESDVVEDDTAR